MRLSKIFTAAAIITGVLLSGAVRSHALDIPTFLNLPRKNSAEHTDHIFKNYAAGKSPSQKNRILFWLSGNNKRFLGNGIPAQARTGNTDFLDVIPDDPKERFSTDTQEVAAKTIEKHTGIDITDEQILAARIWERAQQLIIKLVREDNKPLAEQFAIWYAGSPADYTRMRKEPHNPVKVQGNQAIRNMLVSHAEINNIPIAEVNPSVSDIARIVTGILGAPQIEQGPVLLSANLSGPK